MLSAPESLMAVMAHPDDAELWAGGTLARIARAGTDVTIVVQPYGETRAEEAAAGAEILGATLRLVEQPTAPAFLALLKQSPPEVVVTHGLDDVHPGHRAVARALFAAIPDAVISTGLPLRAYTCDGYNNLDFRGQPLDLPVIVDVTDTWDVKRAALAAHRSQPIAERFWPMADLLGRLHGRRIGRTFAEAFRAAPVLGRLPEAKHL